MAIVPSTPMEDTFSLEWTVLLILFLVVALLVLGVVWQRLRMRLRRMERLVTEQRKELTARDEIAAVAMRSLDLNEILSGALEKTLREIDVEAGGIYLVDEDAGLLRIAAQRGLVPELAAEINDLRVGEGFSGRVIESGEPLVVEDISKDARLSRLKVAQAGLKSLAVVPLTAKGKPLGTLFAVTQGVRKFDDVDVQFLVSSGQQIAAAVENARLFAVVGKRAEQFRLLAEVGRQITLTLDLNDIMQQVVRLLQGAFDYYHVGIGLIEGDEVVYRVGAGALWDDPSFTFKPQRLKVGKEGLTGWVAGTGEPLVVPDVGKDPRYVWMQGSATRSEVLVPLAVKGRVLGVLDVQSDRLQAFDETDVMVLQSLAHQASVAIENARLYDQAQQSAVLEERQRIARELHDAVTQTLFSASLIAQALPAVWNRDQQEGQKLLSDLRQLSRGALAEMRTLLLEMRPAVLAETSLGDLLRQLSEAASGREGIPVELSVEGAGSLPSEVHVSLYRIAQEAVNNMAKHARAKSGKIMLAYLASGGVELQVEDDGRGFSSEDVQPNEMGLGIMRERAQAIGANVSIHSRLGAGTVVKVRWESDRPC